MICANCGANNPPESAYCGGCGSPLVPARNVAARESVPPQEPSVVPPSEQIAPAAASISEDMPTFHSMEPVPEQASQASAIEEAPTVREAPAIEETPTIREAPAQPTPASNEFRNESAPVPQPAAPTPNFANSAPPAQAPWPTPPLVPGYPSGPLYAPQGQVPAPGYASGVYSPAPGGYPPQTPLPIPGAYPPQTPLPGTYGSGAYPAQGQPVSGVFPPQGQPSGVFPPTVGEFPAGVYPTPFPGQPSQAAWGVPGSPGAPQATQPSKLINPLPLWAFISSIVVVAVLLLLLTFFTGSDWAAGAQTAGIVALVIGVLILIAFGVRAGLGMLAQTNPHRRAQIISSLLLTLLLIAVGAFGLTQQAAMHDLQAHALEGQHNWQTAINEYQAAGQGAPSSEDIARTYNEWGELLLSQGQTDNAIAKFDIVYNTYSQATTGVAQAKSNAIAAYQGVAAQAVQKQDYISATKHYDALLAEPYCQSDHACQSQYSAADATAYYKLAEQKLNLQPPDYAAAVAAFNKLTTAFSSSPESQSAHADYARALWGDGQQLLNTACSSALPLYQQLSSQFADTQQGKEATTALQQPESVKGQFSSNIPTSPEIPTVALMQGISPGMSDAQFTALFAKSPLAVVQSDGTFKFKPVKQGSYYLVWGTFNQSTGAGAFYDPLTYPAAVGPLCTLDMGQINESFPKA